MVEDEFELLRKFKDIIEVSREVRKAEIAKYLGISEENLFEKLILWGKRIPFKIKLDSIEIDDMNGFMDALDRQFDEWENKDKSEKGKYLDKTSEKSLTESSVFVSEVLSTQPPSNTNLQEKFEFLMDYAENSINSQRYDEAIKYYEKASTVAEDLLDGDLIRKTEDLIKKVKEIMSIRYQETLLVGPEYHFMMELDKMLGIIPQISDKSESFGFITHNKHIVQLNLKHKKISFLPYSIGSLSSLSSLNIEHNELTSLPHSIGSLTSLSSLNIEHNELTSLPDSIGSLTTLTNLSLNFNQITSLPDSMGNLASLEELGLNSNCLSSLPVSIGHLLSLKKLNLRKNQLTSLPDSIGNLTSLEELDLTANNLSSLPDGIINLISFTKLLFSKNYLIYHSDTIKKWLETLKNKGCYILK